MSKTKSVFELHPSLKSYHETSDGTKFFNNGDAMTHARGLKDKKVSEVHNDGKKSKPSSNSGSGSGAAGSGGAGSSGSQKPNPMAAAKLRVTAINKLETIKEVEAALKDETAGSVKKAGALRIEAIKAAVEAAAGSGSGSGEAGDK